MINLKTGIDLVEIRRIEQAIQRYGDRLLNRIYTPMEIVAVGSNIASLAARFAAKEAVSKALGTGIGDIGWREIEILYSEANAPVVYLKGNAKKKAEELGLSDWSLSLSHTNEYAIAVVIAVGLK
jgi:holo-[acyl-carrier protein] synthase